MVAICNLGLSAVSSSISYLTAVTWLQYSYSKIQDTCFFFLFKTSSHLKMLIPIQDERPASSCLLHWWVFFLPKVKKVHVIFTLLSQGAPHLELKHEFMGGAHAASRTSSCDEHLFAIWRFWVQGWNGWWCPLYWVYHQTYLDERGMEY